MKTHRVSDALPTAPPFPQDRLSHIHELAHKGTKEAVEELYSILQSEDDFQFKEYVQLALDECNYFYYSPHNEKEEKEFMLLKLIERKERELIEEQIKIDRIRFREEEASIFIKIANKVQKRIKNMEQKELSKEKFLMDGGPKTRDAYCKEEIEDNIHFLESWLEEARKSITLEKYKTIPPDVLYYMYQDYENWE